MIRKIDVPPWRVTVSILIILDSIFLQLLSPVLTFAVLPELFLFRHALRHLSAAPSPSLFLLLSTISCTFIVPSGLIIKRE